MTTKDKPDKVGWWLATSKALGYRAVLRFDSGRLWQRECGGVSWPVEEFTDFVPLVEARDVEAAKREFAEWLVTPCDEPQSGETITAHAAEIFCRVPVPKSEPRTLEAAKRRAIDILESVRRGKLSTSAAIDQLAAAFAGVPSEPEVVNGPAMLPIGWWVIEDVDGTRWLTRSIGGEHNRINALQRAVRVPDMPPREPAFVLPPPGTTFWAEVDVGGKRKVCEFHRFSDGTTMRNCGASWNETGLIAANARIVEGPKQ